ncbi:hypothetical protein U8Q05_25630 [Rhizobium ruizarguesonis]|nr:hypothetical protein U8Q05_25630 [Rhizobium ruizarguesonis]
MLWLIGIPISVIILSLFFSRHLKRPTAALISSAMAWAASRPNRRQAHGQAIMRLSFFRNRTALALPEPGAGILIISTAQISSLGGGACLAT